MKKLIAFTLISAVSSAAFGQQFTPKRPDVGKRYNVVSNGAGGFTVTEGVPIISHHPIKPYGLNLQPANIPKRKAPVPTFDPSPDNPGPLVIENPYYVDPLEEELQSLASIRTRLLLLFKRIFRLP